MYGSPTEVGQQRRLSIYRVAETACVGCKEHVVCVYVSTFKRIMKLSVCFMYFAPLTIRHWDWSESSLVPSGGRWHP